MALCKLGKQGWQRPQRRQLQETVRHDLLQKGNTILAARLRTKPRQIIRHRAASAQHPPDGIAVGLCKAAEGSAAAGCQARAWAPSTRCMFAAVLSTRPVGRLRWQWPMPSSGRTFGATMRPQLSHTLSGFPSRSPTEQRQEAAHNDHGVDHAAAKEAENSPEKCRRKEPHARRGPMSQNIAHESAMRKTKEAVSANGQHAPNARLLTAKVTEPQCSDRHDPHGTHMGPMPTPAHMGQQGHGDTVQTSTTRPWGRRRTHRRGPRPIPRPVPETPMNRRHHGKEKEST